MNIQRVRTALILLAITLYLAPRPAFGQATSATITLFGKNTAPLSHLTDGDAVRLLIRLPQAATENTAVTFHLKGLEPILANCNIAAQKTSCQTEFFSSLGWYWNPVGEAQPERTILAKVGATDLAASSPIRVSPRPVVMVHGFNSSWEAWTSYLGPTGYLAEIGISAYAVGDGQVAGVMNTGSLNAPTQRTNTIAENAAILGEYIQNVQKATGAEKVDLLVHSMGGMISRYYIDRLMKNGEVAQLIILGTPMAGSNCADLPASLGFYLPATLEIQPGYMTKIFNPQITHRRGVPFRAIAGTQILDSIQSPCTSVPSDIVVSLDSIQAIPMEITQIPLLHIDLNTSRDVFETFVKPMVQTPPGAFPIGEDSTSTPGNSPALQFTGTYNGHLQPGDTKSITIAIDPNITVASFGLYDSSRSLSVSVQGASGKTIALNAENNGLIVIDDPNTLIYLGYGFKNPKPGAWVVTLTTTERTPATGADYALQARFEGGATLEAATNPVLPRQGERVTIQASLHVETAGLPIGEAKAKIHLPDGKTHEITLNVKDNRAEAVFIPQMAGLHGVEIQVTATTPDGMAVDRAIWLAFEAQPSDQQTQARLLILFISCIGLLLVVVMLLWLYRRRRKPSGR